MRDSVVEFVRDRAAARCEYCLLPEAFVKLPFEIEHIVPKQHRGSDAFGNLAWSCLNWIPHS